MTATITANTNTKKLASRTLENMCLKASHVLLQKSPKDLAEFSKILDRSKREIALARGENSALKRVYAVETEARYNLLVKVLGTSGEALTTERLNNDTSLTPEDIRIFMLFRGVNLDNVFSSEEQEIFADLNESDMKQNIYLGVDCTKTDK